MTVSSARRRRTQRAGLAVTRARLQRLKSIAPSRDMTASAAEIGMAMRGHGSPSRAGPHVATAVRWASAIVFAVFGVGKFVEHSAELASFRDYGLPAPDAFVYAIGVLEVGGALLLAAGVLVRLAAVALAADMVAAIVISGLRRGELVSLTLAPVLLAGMLFLLVAGGDARRGY